MRQVKCDGCGAVTREQIVRSPAKPTETELAWRVFLVDWKLTLWGGKSAEHVELHACSDDCARKVLAELPLVKRSQP